MPELPEVETIARGLDADLAGAEFSAVEVLDASAVSSGDGALCLADLPPALAGARVLRAWRRGKVLVLDLARPRNGVLHLCFHLRMTGRLTVEAPGQAARPHTRIVFSLADGRSLLFGDVRRFGSCRAMAPGDLPRWKFWASLGPEPLEMGAAEFADRLAGRRARTKALLLDQSVVAGVGNIYADESLFRAGIRPDTRADTVPRKRLLGLHAALVEVLKEAIAANGSSISDYVNAHGDAGAFQNDFRVYGRAGRPCRICKTPLSRRTVAGRTSVFCEKCQK
ncbi:bifunctional DNA-formamidopyrimidine glycosylase/DNA-(apurinic or apyrimidinic site) lyase [Desulfocurvus sp. DL9XJH121]